MLNLSSNKSMLRVLCLMGIVLCGVLCWAFYSEDVGIMVFLIFGILALYYGIILRIISSSFESTFLSDGRFYLFSAILAYSILPPIYGILTLSENNGVKLRTTYYALTYTAHELQLTLWMSFLFFSGLLIGIMARSKKTFAYKEVETAQYEANNTAAKRFYSWLVVCIISTICFLLPFFRGGFRIILAGGTISDVDTIHESSLLWRIVDIFFSNEMMTASTVAVLYYGYKMNMQKRKKKNLLFSIVAIEAILAYLTTRRARAIAIILCAFIIYINWYKKEKGKLPIGRIVSAGVLFIFMYFLEVIMGQVNVGVTYASYLRLFDGVPAYDSLLLATRNQPSLSMLSNIVYGLFRHIPILGKYIVGFLGIANDAAPLYKWMAERYTVYQYGGGLAYTPQLEAYLCIGFFGCFFFGIIYGYIFGKPRRGLSNLFVAAIAFSIARGNLQIALSLMWPFGIIGYYFYDDFLFRRIKIGGGHRITLVSNDN